MLWLIVCLPLAVLLSWLIELPASTAIAYSVLTALPLAGWMWFSVQSANLVFKWPALQLIGWTTVLISVVVVCLPLHLLLPAQTVGYVALFLWIGVCIYGVFAANKIHNKHLLIESAKVDKPFRLVQLSDIHAGSRSSAFVKKSMDQANRHTPDAVVITGDLLDSSAVDSRTLKSLSESKCPVWMCLGNHERYVDLQSAIDAIEHNNTIVLRDRSVCFKNICLVGIDDADDPDQVGKVLPSIERNKQQFNILLYHKPDGWAAACDHGIDLMLAGHTHAGQVWPFGLLVKRQFTQMVGHFSRDQKHLYVSPGTGTWGPILRLGTQCEMTVIDLKPAA